jgi:hypothetical protein
MSGSTLSYTSVVSGGTLTLTVGQSGSFTNDASLDVASVLNPILGSAGAAGETIKLIFNSGYYGEAGPLLLPSNTAVFGNDATIGIQANVSSGGFGLIENENSYYENGFTRINSGGTILGSLTVTPTDLSYISGGVIDQNISVEGLTLNETGTVAVGNSFTNVQNSEFDLFGFMITNAENIDVQDNTFIGGGNDATAFRNVENAVAANNIALGQFQSFDNWDGPVNTTIEDNEIFVGGNGITGASVGIQVNSNPSGDPANPGNAVNDAGIDNVITGETGATAISETPLREYDSPTFSTTMSSILDQGNLALGLGYYLRGVENSMVQDNLLADVLEPAPGYSLFSVITGGTGTNTFVATNTSLVGNVDFGGADSGTSLAVYYIAGESVAAANNAVLDSTVTSIPIMSISGPATGNVSTSAAHGISGSVVAPVIAITAPPTIFATADTATPLSGTIPFAITNVAASDSLSATLTATFGTFSSSAFPAEDGQSTIVLTGNLAALNATLSSLAFTSNAAGWDDVVELTVSDSSNTTLSATRDIPVLVALSAAETASTGISTINGSLLNATLSGGAPLAGNILVSQFGNNVLNMGSTASMAFLGTGNNTVQGGSGNEYIAAGSGAATVNLAGGGDVTVAGGAGHLNVAASTGADLIEAGASTASITGGTGAISLVGGLGTVTYRGGAGSSYIATLPQDGGALLAALGTGNSTIFALSGNDSVATTANTANLIDLGIGTDTVASAGADTILGGAGASTINLVSTATDSITTGTGTTSLIYYSANSLAIAARATVNAAAGNFTVSPLAGGAVSVTGGIASLTAASGNDNFTLEGDGAATISATGAAATSVYFSNTDHRTDLNFINSSNDAATIYAGSAGSTTAYGGANGGFFVGGALGGNSLIGGSGAVQLVGIGYNDTLSAASNASNILVAGAGAETLLGGPGSNVFYLGLDNAITGNVTTSGLTSAAGSGANVFLIGNVNGETIYGANGGLPTNTYDVVGDATTGNSLLTIANFFNLPLPGRTTQVIWLVNASLNGAGDATIAGEQIVGFGTNQSAAIYLSDGTTILLKGISSLSTISTVNGGNGLIGIV